LSTHTHNTTARTQDQTDPASKTAHAIPITLQFRTQPHAIPRAPPGIRPATPRNSRASRPFTRSSSPCKTTRSTPRKQHHPPQEIMPQSRPVFRNHPKSDPHASQRRT